MMRRQLMPLPRMKPGKPSSCQIRTRLRHTPRYWLSVDTVCTCLYKEKKFDVNKSIELKYFAA